MSLQKVGTPSSVNDFWSQMSRMYKNRDYIRESSNRIVELAANLQSFITPENDKAVYQENGKHHSCRCNSHWDSSLRLFFPKNRF